MAMAQEEKVARKISDLVSDLRLDLDYVAFYIKQVSPTVAVNRILLTAELLQSYNEEEKTTHYDY